MKSVVKLRMPNCFHCTKDAEISYTISRNQTEQQMVGYHQVIKMPSRTAHLTITLP